jgi:SAM-dependent methyltransferase
MCSTQATATSASRTNSSPITAAAVGTVSRGCTSGVLDEANAIALWHVLEHVDRPAELLAAAAAALVPGGVLVVATPNLGSLQFRLLGARWPHVDAPRHLALVPLATLEQRMTELGLEREAVTTADPAGEYDAFGWQGLIARPVERRNFNGSAYTAVFRKRERAEGLLEPLTHRVPGVAEVPRQQARAGRRAETPASLLVIR